MAERNDLLDTALAAHGGLDRWQSASSIEARLSAAGFAFASRFKRRGWRSVEMRISTREPCLEMSPYPRAGKRGIFRPDDVRIESDAGELVAERHEPRAAFRGLRHKIWWDDLDMLYFGGYAAWNYFNTPFLLARPGFTAREIEPWVEGGESLRRLAVTYPADIPAHSREQVLCFDGKGLLRRFDYTAEVFGAWAKAAHYCLDYRECDGIMVPMRRRVYPRRKDGRPRGRPTLVWIDVERVAFTGERDPVPSAA